MLASTTEMADRTTVSLTGLQQLPVGNHTVIVSFLIIGVQKGGTTVLWAYLKRHPSIGMPSTRSADPEGMRNKELHFFDDRDEEWERPNYEKYHSYWSHSDRKKPAVGEATPSYIYNRNTLARIAQYNPKMKLIVILRDPAERAYSAWWMGVTNGIQKKNFSFCIRAITPKEKNYLRRGFYADQLNRVYNVFPRDQVLILQTEKLRADPTAVLNRTTRFLGIPAFAADVVPLVMHERLKQNPMSEDDRRYLDNIFAVEMELLKPMLEENHRIWP